MAQQLRTLAGIEDPHLVPGTHIVIPNYPDSSSSDQTPFPDLCRHGHPHGAHAHICMQVKHSYTYNEATIINPDSNDDGISSDNRNT